MTKDDLRAILREELAARFGPPKRGVPRPPGVPDPWLPILRTWLDGRAETTMREVLGALGLPEASCGRAESTRAGAALSRLGWHVSARRTVLAGHPPTFVRRERVYRKA